jgi:glyoxylase-like metal-dependent hydrolase (beta-lactamase superfamily II)
MILENVCVGPMEVNCYILASNDVSSAIIIDPGAQERKIRHILDRHKLKAAFLINTHGHFDHIGCDDKFDVPVYIHSKDAALLENPQLNLSGLFALPYRVKSKIKLLEDNMTVELGDIQLKVMYIPGHTPGGIALLMQKPRDKIVFTGDTLFCQGIGRTDFTGGNEALLIESIKEKLLSLPDDTIVYPGHGPSTTIGEEKRHNPFLM